MSQLDPQLTYAVEMATSILSSYVANVEEAVATDGKFKRDPRDDVKLLLGPNVTSAQCARIAAVICNHSAQLALAVMSHDGTYTELTPQAYHTFMLSTWTTPLRYAQVTGGSQYHWCHNIMLTEALRITGAIDTAEANALTGAAIDLLTHDPHAIAAVYAAAELGAGLIETAKRQSGWKGAAMDLVRAGALRWAAQFNED